MHGSDAIARPALHEIGLELQFARGSANAGSHALVRHGDQCGTNLERASDFGRHRGKSRALAEAFGPVEVGAQVQIAELKPSVRAQMSQGFQASKAIAANAPAMPRVR